MSTPARRYAWEAIAKRLGLSTETSASLAAALGLTTSTDPTDELEGDVSGTLPGPLRVTGLGGSPIDGPPADGDVLSYDEASDTWVLGPPAAGSGANAPIVADLSNPPTQAELETGIGSIASAVPGQSFVLVDADTNLTYGVVSDGDAFVFVPLVETATDAVGVAAAAGIFSDFAAMWCAAQYDPVSNSTFWAYLNAAGDACVRSWDHATQTASAATVLHAALSAGDSHAQPAILIRSSDRKVLVFYGPHANTHMYLRISSAAADISAFAAETDLAASIAGTDYTYPIAYELTDGIYLFLRTATGITSGGQAHVGATWSYSKSTDNGATWSAKTQLVKNTTYGMYWAPSKTAVDRVDFMAVNRSTFDNAGGSVYHFYMLAGGACYRTDGTLISATKPFDETAMTLVWASSGTNHGDQGQIILGSDGYPRCVFRNFETVISPDDCHYRWGRWDGAAWSTVEVATAGSGSLTATIVFTDGDPYTIWYSKDSGGVAQIHRATTSDEGATWIDRAITDSANEQALLATVRDGPADLSVIWCAKSGGWTRNDTVAADFFGASFVPGTGAQLQRLVSLSGDTLGTSPLAEIVLRIGSDGIAYYSLDLGTTWVAVATPLTVKDEGGSLATAATALDFVGAGVAASGSGATKTITIAGVTAALVRDAGRWEPTVDGGTDTLIFDAHTVVMDWTTT